MKLLTVEDLAKRWRCSTSRINQLPKDKLPPRFELPGSRTRFWREDVVEAWERALPGGMPLDSVKGESLTPIQVAAPPKPEKKRGPGAPRRPVLADRSASKS